MPIGVTTQKNINPITSGETTFPNNNPNLNHKKFRGFNNFEFRKPKIKKITDIIKDQILTSELYNNGHKAISKNTIEKTNPKLLFEPIFIFIITIYIPFSLISLIIYFLKFR